MTLQVEQAPSLTGLQPTYTAVAATDTWAPLSRGSGARYLLHVKNAGASPDIVTVDDPNTVLPAGGSGADAARDVAISVTNAQERFILIDNVDRFVNPSTGLVTITHSFQTSVTIGIFRII